jgi:hypothetical protein
LKKLIFSLLLSLSALSAEYSIKSINEDLKVISVTSTGKIDLKKDESLKVNDGDCTLKIIEIRKDSVLASSKDCAKTKLNIGQKLVKENSDKEFKDAKKIISKGNGLQAKNESWYIYWGLGPASIIYDDPAVEAAANTLQANPAVDHLSFALDFGVYFPLKTKIMHGFAISGAVDSYTVGATELDIFQYLYAYSIQKFFGEHIGDSWFIRGDAGLVKYRSELIGTGVNISSTSDTGFGILFGGGYSKPLSDENRIMFSGNFAIRKAGDDRVDTFAITIGFLH